MYSQRPNLILGFHGCDEAVRDQLLVQPNKYKISKETFDWLGHGIYFWENNYARALEWAIDKKKRNPSIKPSVVGAIILLGNCCDLTDKVYIDIVKSYYHKLRNDYLRMDQALPVNKNLKDSKDKLLRELDCTLLEYLHNNQLAQYKHDLLIKSYSDYPMFDSTRAAFIEGAPAYSGAGIFDKSHIQICVRNSNCIKGFFMPRNESKWPV